MIKEFTIDDQYLTDVKDSYTKYKYDLSKELTNDQLADVLVNGNIVYTSHGIKDHPEFAKLREELKSLGYITVERGWWNGDRVIKKFKLNGKLFKSGDKFVCAGAMKLHLKYKE